VVQSKRQYLARAVYLLVFLGIMLAAWPSGPNMTRTLLENSGHAFTVGLIWLQMIVALVWLPSVVAVSLAAEKETGNINLLIITRLSALEICAGKLLSHLGYMFIFQLLGFPLFMLVMNMGSVSLREILAAELVVVATALLAGAAGTVIGSIRNRAAKTVSSAYLWLALFLGLLSIPSAFPRWASVSLLSPIIAADEALNASVGSFPGIPFWQRILPCFVLALGLTIVALLWGAFRIRRYPEEADSKLPEKRSFKLRWLTEFCFSLASRGRARSDAVLWRELRVSLPEGNAASSAALVLGLLLLCGLAFVMVFWPMERDAVFISFKSAGAMRMHELAKTCVGFSVLSLAVIFGISGMSAATHMVQDRTSGSLLLLASTPLDANDILLGKARGLVRYFVLMSSTIMFFGIATAIWGYIVECSANKRGFSHDAEAFGGYCMAISYILSFYFLLQFLVYQGVAQSMDARNLRHAISKTMFVLPVGVAILVSIVTVPAILTALFLDAVFGVSASASIMLAIAFWTPLLSAFMAAGSRSYLRRRAVDLLNTFLETHEVPEGDSEGPAPAQPVAPFSSEKA